MTDETDQTEIVYLTPVAGRSRRYHTDRGCGTISHVDDDRVNHRELSSLDDRYSECGHCSDDPIPGIKRCDRSLYQLLSDDSVSSIDDVQTRLGEGAD